MKPLIEFFRPLRVLLIACLVIGSSASAHLMVAQKGTLNVSGNGGYLVVSVPTSALDNVDDDGDGLLSAAELSAHTPEIEAQLTSGLQLTGADGLQTLEGILLTLSPQISEHGGPADQLVVMGRYSLSDPDAPLSFQTDLWGTHVSEQSLSLSVTQEGENSQLLTLTPQHPEAKLYEPALNVLTSYLRLGAEHVLGGLDHLLFLLIVLAAGLSFRKVVTALSIFTLGHALSLLALVYGALSVPAALVEPTIAATIIALAFYDFWLARNKARPRVSRLLLIFGCSLIHGLGLGSALSELGISAAQQGVTLLGFNLGIELAQLGVAALTLLGFALLRRGFGVRGVRTATSLMTLSAVVVSGVWFVQRVMF